MGISLPKIKKPAIVQNIQSGAQKLADKAGDIVRPAAQTVAKEAGYVVNPIAGEVAMRAKELAKNPDIAKVGNAIANTTMPKLPGFFKNISMPSLPKPAQANTNVVDTIGNAVKQGVQWVGNTVSDVLAPGTSGREAKTKIAGPNPLEQERSGKQAMKNFGSEGNPQKDFEGLTPMTSVAVLDDPNANPVTAGIQRVQAALANAGGGGQAPQGLPQEGVLVAGNGATPVAGAAAKKPSIQTIADKLVNTFGDVVTTGVNKAGEAVNAGKEWLQQGTDSLTVKGFTTTYGDVLTPKMLQRFRDAEAKGDIATMDSIKAEAKQLKAQQGVK